jgi:hypoxanthine phosphoribosyltransferase
VRLSSYHNTESTGEVKGVEGLVQIGLDGKNVLLVEDMIDTGTTMKAVLNTIKTTF